MKKIGRYKVRVLLGRGGMAPRVYKAAMPRLGRFAPMKLLSTHPRRLFLRAVSKKI